MNQTDDACRDRFTEGQYDLMRSKWATYRKDP